MKRIKPSEIGARSFYRYMTSAIAPRPIALVSTVDKSGNVNLSPFSFFNYMGIDPPMVVFAPNNREDGSSKDTTLNILEVGEAVVNLVDEDIIRQMSLSSASYVRGTNEFLKAGFTSAASEIIRPPRVVESLVQLECRVVNRVEIGSMNLVIAEVVLAHINERILDSKGEIDPMKTRWISRGGGDWYSRSGKESYFKIPRPLPGIGVDSLPFSVRNSAILTGNDLGILGSIPVLPPEEEIRQYRYNEVIVGLKEQTAGVCGNFNELLHLRVKELLREEKHGEALLAALQSH